MGALSHLRVLDLTRVLAGPWCTQTLADLGVTSTPASALKMGETPVEYRRPLPLLGEHAASVLQELTGLGAAEIESLQQRQVI